MSDPAIIIATLATCIAILSTAVAWIALDSSRLTREWHNQLFKDFWKQSIEQAKENGHQWGFQLRQAEWLRDHLSFPRQLPNKTKQRPN
jgi:hypothetical protein